MRAWQAAGVWLGHYTGLQWDQTRRIPFANLQPGDLVFWATDTSAPSTIYHVALWAGNGMIVEAPSPGQNVREVPMRNWTNAMAHGGRP
jgi:cell wall-associated NlpC family hydrolase